MLKRVRCASRRSDCCLRDSWTRNLPLASAQAVTFYARIIPTLKRHLGNAHASRLFSQDRETNRFDAVEEAEKIFRAIHMPKTLAYNTLINVYAQRGNVEAALMLVNQMKSDFESGINKNCSPNTHTYNMILSALIKSKRLDADEKAEQFFSAISLPDTTTYNTLMNMYARKGNVEKAHNLVHRMHADVTSGKNMDCCPDLLTYNTILKAYQKSNRSNAVEKAEEIFNAISSPDTITYSTLLTIYAQKGHVDKALALLHRMDNNECRPDTQTYNSALNMFQRSTEWNAAEKAVQFFAAIPSPNTVTYNTLINIYAQRGDVENAFTLLHQMQLDWKSGKNKNCRPDTHTYGTILNALQKSKPSDVVERAEQIFGAMEAPNTVTYNILLNIYAKSGDTENALRLLDQMQSDYKSGKNKDCRPNIRTYNTVLNSLQRSDRSDATEKAEQIFSIIPWPDTITYSTLLNVYAKSSETDKALGVFRRMQSDFNSGKNVNCRPDLRTYNTILKVLARSNQADSVEKSQQIFNTIPAPDTITYNTLLNLYANLGMGHDAILLTRRMQQDFDSGTNRACQPDDWTESTVLKAIRIADDAALLESEGQDVLEWFRKRQVRA
jgi:pentatricopeptide repeat protein